MLQRELLSPTFLDNQNISDDAKSVKWNLEGFRRIIEQRTRLPDVMERHSQWIADAVEVFIIDLLEIPDYIVKIFGDKETFATFAKYVAMEHDRGKQFWTDKKNPPELLNPALPLSIDREILIKKYIQPHSRDGAYSLLSHAPWFEEKELAALYAAVLVIDGHHFRKEGYPADHVRFITKLVPRHLWDEVMPVYAYLNSIVSIFDIFHSMITREYSNLYRNPEGAISVINGLMDKGLMDAQFRDAFSNFILENSELVESAF